MLGIIFALISYIGWGTSDVSGTIAARKMGAYAATFWTTLLGFILFSIYAPFVIHDLKKLTIPIFIISLALGIIWTISLFSLNKALSIANPSLVGAIGLSWGAVSVLLSTIFLSEHITGIQIVIIIGIFIGIVVSSVDITVIRKDRKVFLNRGVAFAFIPMIGWGIYGAFLKIPVEHIGWFWPLYITYGVTPLMLFMYMRIRKIQLYLPNHNHALPSIISTSLLSRTAELSYYIGAAKGLIAVIAPIAGSYSTLFVVLSFFIFRESITKQQIIGVLMTVVGIVCLSFVSI